MESIGIPCVLSLTESAAVFPFSLANVRHLKETHKSVSKRITNAVPGSVKLFRA